jgi:hypothetical protein
MFDVIYYIWSIAMIVFAGYFLYEYFLDWEKSRLSKRVAMIKEKIMSSRKKRLRDELEGNK